MVKIYRLHSIKYFANSGKGAALHGGRWNPPGAELIYTAGTLSLAVLEILAHFAVLPSRFRATTITIAGEHIERWSRKSENISAVEALSIGAHWIAERRTVVLEVPSAIIPSERNYLLNPAHPDFSGVQFGRPQSFSFDSRLKAKVR